MIVVCVITEDDHEGLIDFLKPSCEFHNLKLKVLTVKNKYTGHRLKDMLLYEFLKEIDKNELILFTDAFDAYFIASEAEIIEKYTKFNIPIVFSGEIACWPEPTLSRFYPKSTEDTHFRYLNSGGFIGRCGDIIDLIEKYYFGNRIELSQHLWSNQYVWNQIYLNEQDVIKIDSDCEIFYTLCSKIPVSKAYLHSEELRKVVLSQEKDRLLNEMSIEDGRFTNSITSTRPCHVHFNSPAVKELMKTNLLDDLKVWADN